MDDLASAVMDQLNELSTRIAAFDGVFQSLDGLSAAAPAIGRRVKGSLGLLSTVFDEQCSLLLASTIGRRLRAVANGPEHHCEVYRSVLATRESMTQTPAWDAFLAKYPAILSPIDRFLYIYECPACQVEPTADCSDLRAALAQVGAQIKWHKAHQVYLRPVHECLLRMRDWLRARLRPGLPWHEMAQRLADRYALLDSWSRLFCSAVYANAWRLHEAGMYADSVAASMFLLHPNTEHGRYLHSGFLRHFGKLRACYLSGAFTWEKFALMLQAIDEQVAAAEAAGAPGTAEILRRAARRFKRLLKVFVRAFDTDALYLCTDQLMRQEAAVAASLPQLPPFDAADAEENAESDSPILELRHWLTAADTRPGHLRAAADGVGTGMEQGDSRSPLLADRDAAADNADDDGQSGPADGGEGGRMLRTMRVLRGVPPEQLAQLVDSRETFTRLLLRLERHLRLVLDCLDELPRDGEPLTSAQRARRGQIEADANLLLGVLARLMRLAAERGRPAAGLSGIRGTAAQQ